MPKQQAPYISRARFRVVDDDVVVTDCCTNCLRSSFPKTAKKKSVCSACRNARYCDRACQKSDWSQHRPVCNEFKQQAADVAMRLEVTRNITRARHLARTLDDQTFECWLSSHTINDVD